MSVITSTMSTMHKQVNLSDLSEMIMNLRTENRRLSIENRQLREKAEQLEKQLQRQTKEASSDRVSAALYREENSLDGYAARCRREGREPNWD